MWFGSAELEKQVCTTKTGCATENRRPKKQVCATTTKAWRCTLIRQTKFLAWSLWVPLTASVLIAQKKTAPSHPHPAPQVSGTFIDADRTGQRLRLTYPLHSKFETFVGTIHSTCMLPPPSKSGESKPLDLSTIPTGTRMTVSYVSRGADKQSQNIILAVRFDSVLPGSALPQGVYIPCFKGQPAH